MLPTAADRLDRLPPVADHEAVVLRHLQRSPFSRQFEISRAVKLPGDHNNWLTFATLRSLQRRGLVEQLTVPCATDRRGVKVWRPTLSGHLEPVRRQPVAAPVTLGQRFRQWLSLL